MTTLKLYQNNLHINLHGNSDYKTGNEIEENNNYNSVVF